MLPYQLSPCNLAPVFYIRHSIPTFRCLVVFTAGLKQYTYDLDTEDLHFANETIFLFSILRITTPKTEKDSIFTYHSRFVTASNKLYALILGDEYARNCNMQNCYIRFLWNTMVSSWWSVSLHYNTICSNEPVPQFVRVIFSYYFVFLVIHVLRPCDESWNTSRSFLICTHWGRLNLEPWSLLGAKTFCQCSVFQRLVNIVQYYRQIAHKVLDLALSTSTNNATPQLCTSHCLISSCQTSEDTVR